MERDWKPQICYILPRYDPDTSGHFFHNYEFLKRASGELDIFLVIEKASAEPLTLGVRFYCQRFLFLPFRFLELAAVLFRERIRGRRYFYTHYSFYGALASWLITRILGGTAYYWNSGEPWKYRRPRFEEAVFRFILRHTILVTHPAGLAEEYRKRYDLKPKRVTIVPHYIEVARFQSPGNARVEARRKLGIAPETKVILFVHRLSRRKGAHLIPEIAAGVTKARKDVIFLIVGDGPERKNLAFSIQHLGLSQNVRLVGEVPQGEIAPYFAAADVLLLPSEEEGFPHVLLEAMAAGVPFVASNVGGVAEITPPELHDYLVPSNNVRFFAEKITELLMKPAADIAEIANQELEWVAQYDVEAVLPCFKGLFERSIDSDHHPFRSSPHSQPPGNRHRHFFQSACTEEPLRRARAAPRGAAESHLVSHPP